MAIMSAILTSLIPLQPENVCVFLIHINMNETHTYTALDVVNYYLLLSILWEGFGCFFLKKILEESKDGTVSWIVYSYFSMQQIIFIHIYYSLFMNSELSWLPNVSQKANLNALCTHVLFEIAYLHQHIYPE